MTTAVQDPPAAVAGAEQSAREQLALAKPYPAGSSISVQGGLVPQNLDEAARLAQLLAKSSFVPKPFFEKPGDVLAAILYGLDIGLPPMQGLQVIAVINGKPSVYGDGFLAVIQSLPTYQDHEEYYQVGGQRVEVEDLRPEHLKADDTAAICTFWRKGKSKPVTRKFSIAQAKLAQLWGKAGPWQQYPDRMLMLRARGFSGRDTFADGLRGVISAEEAIDIQPIPDPVPAVQMPERASQALTAAAIIQAGGGPPAVPTTTTAPLPEGGDRIASIEAKQTAQGKTYWQGKTERGVEFYTWSTSKGPQAETAKDSGVPVRLMFAEKVWNGKRELVGLTVEAHG